MLRPRLRRPGLYRPTRRRRVVRPPHQCSHRPSIPPCHQATNSRTPPCLHCRSQPMASHRLDRIHLTTCLRMACNLMAISRPTLTVTTDHITSILLRRTAINRPILPTRSHIHTRRTASNHTHRHTPQAVRHRHHRRLHQCKERTPSPQTSCRARITRRLRRACSRCTVLRRTTRRSPRRRASRTTACRLCPPRCGRSGR